MKVSKYKNLNLAFNSSISLWKFVVGGYLAMMSKKRVILLYDIEYEFHGVGNNYDKS